MATGTKLSRRSFLTRTATVAGVATLGAGLSACALAVPENSLALPTMYSIARVTSCIRGIGVIPLGGTKPASTNKAFSLVSLPGVKSAWRMNAASGLQSSWDLMHSG